MITYEQDPDVVQWGLQLFDGDPFSNCGYYNSVTQDDADYYLGHYYKENHYDADCNNVENDELIAHALQEELSQLAVSEEPSTPLGGAEHLQASILQPDWVGQSVDNYGSGQDSGHEEVDDMEPSSSCSSPDEKPYYDNEWSYSLEMMDEFVLDGEVGKRFNQMIPVPHVPRINGEIPSIDEATLDHQRLLGRLQLYDLVELKVKGDGNCQFRALSDQFYRSPEHHKFVRQQVVNQLKISPDIYEGYVPMGYGDYLEKMSKSGEWGDHLTLQAAADSYGVKIFVMTSFKDTWYIEILPNVQRSNKGIHVCFVVDLSLWSEMNLQVPKINNEVIFLSFWAEVHYNSIYPEEDVPALESRKKKRFGMSQNNHLELPNEYQ